MQNIAERKHLLQRMRTLFTGSFSIEVRPIC